MWRSNLIKLVEKGIRKLLIESLPALVLMQLLCLELDFHKSWISSISQKYLSHFKLEFVDMCIVHLYCLKLDFYKKNVFSKFCICHVYKIISHDKKKKKQCIAKHECLQIIPLGLIGTQFNFPTLFDSFTSVTLRCIYNTAIQYIISKEKM